MAMTAPDRTRRGMEDAMTRVSFHPLIKAMTKPAVNVVNSCKNFPTCNKN
jgi:hypothetical protein